MDTTAINFGIEKLKSAFDVALPYARDLSTEYIQFVVAQQVAQTRISIFLLIASALCMIPIFKYGSKKIPHSTYSNYDSPFFVVPVIFNSALLMFVLICSIEGVYNSILAIKFPAMFVIQTLINKG